MKKFNNIVQGTPEWHQKRKGVITGTTLKDIMGTTKKREDAIYEMVAERLTVGVDGGDYESPMDRGTRLEPDALAEFALQTGKTIEITGFVEKDDNALIGYSPDALIEGTDEEDVEVKCPGGKNYVKMWLTDKVPEEYSWQVVQAFIVNPKLQKRYFVGYNPDISIHPIHIIEVTREESLEAIKEAEEAQTLFLEEVDTILKTLIEL
jgi:putative phage-type endonuclease